MSDDLRASLESAFAADAAGTLDTTPAPDAGAGLPDTPAVDSPAAAVPAAPADDRPRNADGTFRAREGDAPAPAPTAQPADKAPVAAPVAPPAGTPAADRIAPPENWAGGAKIRWEKLPRDIQQAIVQDYGRVREAGTKYADLDAVIGPRAAVLTAEYGSPVAAVKQLFALSDFAAQQPQQFLQWFAQTRGLSLAAPAPPAQQPYVDPALAPVLQPIQQQLESVTQKLADYERQTQQREYDSTLQSVGQFMNDRDHPFAAQVAPEMERLINTGAVPRSVAGLQKAYEIATWADPTIRTQLIEQDREKRQRDDQQRVDAARRAGASLNGSPIPGANPNAAGQPGTVRAELEKAWNSSVGAV